jgi:hypothetical protein
VGVGGCADDLGRASLEMTHATFRDRSGIFSSQFVSELIFWSGVSLGKDGFGFYVWSDLLWRDVKRENGEGR